MDYYTCPIGIKSLNAQLAIDDQGEEQAFKEASDQQQLITAREMDYNQINARSAIAKTQHEILKEESKKAKLLSNMGSGKGQKEKNKSEISRVKSVLEKNENKMKAEQIVLDQA